MRDFKRSVILTKVGKLKIKEMSKIMTVDILSSIKGAEPSESVNQLFEVIKNANTSDNNFNTNHNNAVTLDDLREDIVIDSPQAEKQIIIENFPKEKNGFLVVSKVIEE
jgi:Asp-tRNA(Asn)/Glu-tRNA(Gln) amidotransferase C subunit